MHSNSNVFKITKNDFTFVSGLKIGTSNVKSVFNYIAKLVEVQVVFEA